MSFLIFALILLFMGICVCFFFIQLDSLTNEFILAIAFETNKKNIQTMTLHRNKWKIAQNLRRLNNTIFTGPNQRSNFVWIKAHKTIFAFDRRKRHIL